MRKLPCGAMLVILFSLCAIHAGEISVPLLRELRKPEPPPAVEVEDAEPVYPSPVAPERRITDPATISPDGAVWYLTVPDAQKMKAHWDEGPAGVLSQEPAMVKTFRNNRFGLRYLFADLPASVVSPDRVRSMSSVLDLAQVLAGKSTQMAMAAYINDAGDFSFLFLFDVGLDRTETFDILTDWETSFFIANPGADVRRGDHSGNFVDLWQITSMDREAPNGVVAAGFAENIFVLSNNADLANGSLELLSGGNSLAQSHWGRRLAASIPESSTSHAMGYVRMDVLLNGLETTPLAKESVLSWADLIGYGGRDGEAMYYGLEFTTDGARETYMLPASDPTIASSLSELVAKRLVPAKAWAAPSVIPYQPSPMSYLAVMLDGRQLATWLRQDRRLFGQAEASNFRMPASVRPIFTQELATLLTGEFGLASFPAEDGGMAWLMVLPCSSNPEPLLEKTENMIERGAATIRSPDQDWRNRPSWTVLTPNTHRRINGNFLLVAANGDLLISALDQLASGASFASNRDFIRAMKQTETEQGLLFYLNLPEVVVRQYPNLPSIARTLYPRSSGLNSRPPLAMLRRAARGLMAVVAPGNGSEFTRITVQSPFPSLGVIAGSTILTFPRSLRADGRAAMEQSRENMQNLWLKLQLYSSRFGHFPESLEDLATDLQSTVSRDELRRMFTAPAALGSMSPEEAMRRSYRYLAGVTPNDEPDIPLLYEAEPWGEDFAGRYPASKSQSPGDSGDFQKFRQYIQLDGTVMTVSEKRFQEVILPRLSERE